MSDALNGILAGLVAITPAAAYVRPEGAFLIGLLSVLPYKAASELLLNLRIDDPLDASAVHGACGAFGVVLVTALPAVRSLAANRRSESSDSLPTRNCWRWSTPIARQSSLESFMEATANC